MKLSVARFFRRKDFHFADFFDLGGVWPPKHDFRKGKYTGSGATRKLESGAKSMRIKGTAPRGRSGTIEELGEQPIERNSVQARARQSALAET